MDFNSPIFYALGASICSGIYGFLGKVATERKYDVYLYTWHSVMISVFLGAFFFLGDISNFHFDKTLFFTSIILWISDVSVFLLLMKSLSYLSTSLVFINYRVISSFFLICIGIFFFQEQVSFLNLIGFFLWFSVFFLLYENEKKEKEHKEIKKWIIYLSICIIMASIWHAVFKYFASEVHIESFYFFRGIVAFLFVSFIICIRKKKFKYLPKSKKDLLLPVLNAIFFTAYYMFFLQKAYALGYLSISYKILSYSVFIPIILSMIFYGEKLTGKRLIAIALTMVSIIFFMY